MTYLGDGSKSYKSFLLKIKYPTTSLRDVVFNCPLKPIIKFTGFISKWINLLAKVDILYTTPLSASLLQPHKLIRYQAICIDQLFYFNLRLSRRLYTEIFGSFHLKTKQYFVFLRFCCQWAVRDCAQTILFSF